MTYLSKFGSSLNVVNISWAMSMRHCFPQKLLVISENDMPTSSANSLTVQNHFLYCLYVFIGCWRARATRTSIVTDIFSAFLKTGYTTNWTCVLLIVDSPNATVNISNILVHLNSFFTQNLKQFLWSIFSNSKKSKCILKNKLTIQNDWYCQHICI